MPHRAIDTLEKLADFIRLLKSFKLPITVEWRLGRNRSLEQNNLQWKWAAEVAYQLQDRDAADVQAEWKLHHGVPILRADSPAFRESYDRCLKHLPHEVKVKAMKNMDIGITSVMGVRQMTRYLDAVQRECLEMGYTLTDPEGWK